MTREEYRAAVDAVRFSSDFQERTVARLMELAREKEEKPMKNRNLRSGLAAAVVAAALVGSAAAAAVVWLRPGDVAEREGMTALAAAFESDDAITVNKTQTVGAYDVTLMGLVSGEGLAAVEGESTREVDIQVQDDRTYAVLSLVRTDGEPITESVAELTVSPVVDGYAPWQVNAWTLDGGAGTFAEGGVLYYLFECNNVEPFADHTVSLAVYPGTNVPPSAEIFRFGDDGEISLLPDQEGALFVLPLDPSKADPAWVLHYLDEGGISRPVSGAEGDVVQGGENTGLILLSGDDETAPEDTEKPEVVIVPVE